MELRTYTGLWSVERRLYKFYDINLPYPVSMRQIGLFIGSVVPWFALMGVIGVPFAPPFGHLLWLVPPGLFTWWANRPVAEGKKLAEFASSQAKFLFGQRIFARLTPVQKPKASHLTGRVWTAASAEGQ